MKIPWDPDTVQLAVTKHFALKYMRHWAWNFIDLREAIRDAYKVENEGKEKYHIYIQKDGFKKIIAVHYDDENKLLCITGSQGGERK